MFIIMMVNMATDGDKDDSDQEDGGYDEGEDTNGIMITMTRRPG